MCTIRLANRDDFSEIVSVHKKCFRESFSSTLPNDVLESYYLEYFSQHHLFFIAEENNTIIGFVMGYESGTTAYSSFIKNNRLVLLQSILKNLIICNRITWKKLCVVLRDKLSKNNTIIYENIKNASKYGDLLSICVIEQYRGTGIALELVNSFEKELINRNITSYYLSLYPENERGYHFYQKLGMRKVQESKNNIVMYKTIR